MENFDFAYPSILFLLIIPFLYFIWYLLKNKHIEAEITVSTTKVFQTTPKTFRNKLRHTPAVLRVILLVLLVIAMARPQRYDSSQNVVTKGIDIVIALDISSSMLAADFEPNRLEASKEVAVDFITGRPNDRIGLVVFSGESFTQCPLTTDHAVLINLFQEIKSGIIEDGTAIGMGLANAVNRLKDSDAISKVVILLTDGVNNRGSVAPITAAEIAKTYGIRVYTVGVGSEGTAPYPMQTPFGIQYQQMEVEIDEEILQNISALTGGSYFRASNGQELKDIYTEIDKLEKSKIEVREFSQKEELFLPILFLALMFFVVELFLKNFIFRNIP